MNIIPTDTNQKRYGRVASLALISQVQAAVPRKPTARLALIAAETGARFTRERINACPMEWLTTPKHLLCGRTPIDACRTTEGFRRMVVLHGLSLGLDASPSAVEGIEAKDILNDGDDIEGWQAPADEEDVAPGFLGLYTATIVHDDERGPVYIFAAMIASSPVEVRRRLRARVGRLLEDAATVRLGFDWSEPIACAMVSDAMADVLLLAAEDPSSPIARGLDFQIEQRFAY